MNQIAKSITVALLVAAMGGSAFANGPRGYYAPGPHHGGHGGHGHRGHNSGWVAPLLFLGLAGAVIGAAASQQRPAPVTYVTPHYESPPAVYVQPAPTYYAPAVSVPPAPVQPANAWYFCKSVGQYYPYTQYCPEGWQLVAPTPQ